MGKAEGNLLTLAEYARHRECSRTAVSKAVKEGRITVVDGKVNPALADVEWSQNTRARAGSLRVSVDASEGDHSAAPTRRDPDEYTAARVRRERAAAELLELQLGEARGDLLRRAVVEQAVGELASGTREAVLQVVPRVAALVAAEADPVKVRRMLETELREALDQRCALPE